MTKNIHFKSGHQFIKEVRGYNNIFKWRMTFKELQRANSSNCFSPNTEHHYSYDHKTTITSLMKHLKKKSRRILKIWSKINKNEKRISFF